MAALVPYIDWQFFFHAWDLKGKFPAILDQPAARELYDDARALLDDIVPTGCCRLAASTASGRRTRRATTSWSARYPVLLHPAAGRSRRRPPEPVPGRLHRAAAGTTRRVRRLDPRGGRARGPLRGRAWTTIGRSPSRRSPIAWRRPSPNGCTSGSAASGTPPTSTPRTELVGRAVPRHPACVRVSGVPGSQREGQAVRAARRRGIRHEPDRELRDAAGRSGERRLLRPPESRYFAVGRIGRDQLADYAERKGEPVEVVERWLAPILTLTAAVGYPPARRRLWAPRLFSMRTTLKRGVGRAAHMNGNGRAILPPTAVTAVTHYEQPPRRTKTGTRRRGSLWVSCCSPWRPGPVSPAARTSGRTGWWGDPGAFAAGGESQKALDVPLPNAPAIALVIGYDHRAGVEANRPSLSDTLMLIRTDPVNKTISLLSFPRDLTVPIYCSARRRVHDATGSTRPTRSGGPKGTVLTIKHLTGLPINYLITVNFHGFKEVVNKLGGVWMDIDRRYYNKNVGTASTDYANIDLQPGYQRLNGEQALDFVRFRHTDSDLYRVARQQEFVRSFREQVAQNFSFGKVPPSSTRSRPTSRSPRAVTRCNSRRSRSTRTSAIRCPPGTFSRTRSRACNARTSATRAAATSTRPSSSSRTPTSRPRSRRMRQRSARRSSPRRRRRRR